MSPHLAVASLYHHQHAQHPRANDVLPGHERIELMLSGRGWIIEDGTYREVLPGDLLWHGHGDRTVCRNDPENPYACLLLRFEFARSQARWAPRVSHWDDKLAIQQFSKETIRCFHDDDFDRSILSAYTYNRLRFQVERHRQQHVPSALPQQLQLFLSLIEQRFQETISIDDFAAAIDWSSAHLHAQCRQHLDASPLQMLLRQRINYAKERLCSNRHSIKMIAQQCGFNSSSHFCRSFKQHSGISPEQFRRAHWAST